ncbi:MAG: hypothetical protein N2645_19600 [Clostridia bacterium]|nr:hypothetical protein [Clostridia bacterium]
MDRIQIQDIVKSDYKVNYCLEKGKIKILFNPDTENVYEQIWEMTDSGKENNFILGFDKGSGIPQWIEIKYSDSNYCPLNDDRFYTMDYTKGIPKFKAYDNSSYPVMGTQILQLGKKTLRVELFREKPMKYILIGKNIVFELNGLNELCAVTIIDFEEKNELLMYFQELRSADSGKWLTLEYIEEIESDVAWDYDSALYINISNAMLESRDKEILHWRLDSEDAKSSMSIDIDKHTGMLTQIEILLYGRDLIALDRDIFSTVEINRGVPAFKRSPWRIELLEGKNLQTNAFKFFDLNEQFVLQIFENCLRIEFFYDEILFAVESNQIRYEFNKNSQLCGITLKNFDNEISKNFF